MSENEQNNQNSEKVEEAEAKKPEEEEVKAKKPEEEEAEAKKPEEEEEKAKTKFTFKCTRVDTCCMGRGPIPITFWDLELWAKNGVIANFMPYLDIYQKPDGGIDLVLKPLPPAPKEGEEKDTQKDPLETVPIKDLLDVKCPLYNKNDKKCLIYDNRPLSCRTYPLEFDGKNFIVVDADCPGVGKKEELVELVKMRETAKTMNYELTRMRIALPVLNQIVSNNFMRMLMKQQMEAMSKMSDDDRSKLDDILKKQEPEHDHDSDHDHEH
jgi:Fe-S-cluster containining protein